MGIARRQLAEADLIVTVWDGPVSADDWAQVADAQAADPGAAQATRRLTDARTAETAAITAADVDSVSTTFEQSEVTTSGMKLAIVATEGWKTAQQVEISMRALGVTTVVFNNVHVACTWLGVDPALVLATIAELRRELREPGLTG